MDAETMLLRATLRRCRGQICRPLGVSGDDERRAMDEGYLRFNEWPSGHYEITRKGQMFLEDTAPPDDGEPNV